jgi:hypothetical protein
VTVSLVTFTFRSDRYVAPTREIVGTASLEYHLDRVREGARERFDWRWKSPEIPADTALAWLEANTVEVLALRVERTLAQCVDWTADTVTARYLFDHEYAHAHPEADDPEHLSLAHGTIAAKLYDDGAIALTDDGVRASLRWRPLDARGTRLSLSGRRQK